MIPVFEINSMLLMGWSLTSTQQSFLVELVDIRKQKKSEIKITNVMNKLIDLKN